MPSNTAFTSVYARQNLVPSPQGPEMQPIPSSAASPSVPSTSPSSNTKTKSSPFDWPLPVRLYVQRSFAPENTKKGVSNPDLEAKLKLVIKEAAESNQLHLLDWDAMLLPQEMLLSERATTVKPINSPWRALSSLGAQESKSTNGSHPKKRKSVELDNSRYSEDSDPPWRKATHRGTVEERVTKQPSAQSDRAEKRQRKNPDKVSVGDGPSKSYHSLEKRKRRFEDDQLSVQAPQPFILGRDTSPLPSPDEGPIVGRSQTLEKQYFRLTSAPNPDSVRPLPVLEQTLELLKLKWRKESNYAYICDQFKSLRQDLTVQHIKNEFTVNVYEIHARIALEKGDLGEYNQCQTQLRALYPQNLGGHPPEFKAYRILYFIHTCNRTDMNDVLADLTQAEKNQPAIQHALDVRSALALGNYHKFFRLYLETPNMGAYLMDMFVVRERVAALANICRAYKPNVKIRFITEELGFESDGESVKFLIDLEAQALLEECDDGLRLLTGQAGSIFESAKNAAFRRVKI
ncbi:MAG: hypothetical protein M1836_006637 [Candelina mexicana]|nr:MAG: hypothetical protein M1836_006637 [Candelina mexicana]